MARPSKEQIQERERLAELGLKQCSEKAGCGEIKSVEDFGLNKSKWDNRRSVCLICDRNHSKKYYKKSPEVAAAYYQEHREERNAYNRQHYLNNQNARQEYARTYRVERNQENPLYIRLQDGEKRARKAGVEWQNISSADLLSHWQQEDVTIDTCYYCKQTVNIDDFHLDHGIPLSRGGSHSIDNLFPAHGSCNLSKKDRTVEEYMSDLKQVS